MASSTLKTIGLFATFLAVLALIVVVVLKPISSGTSEEGIKEIVRQYIDENPESIMNSLTKYQVSQQQAENEGAKQNIASSKEQLENDPTSPIAGNPNGDVTIVEFFDYSCGYCKRVLPHLLKLIDEDPGLKIVFKELPILGPPSLIASKASLAVNASNPEKYAEIHKVLMKTRVSGKDSVLKVITDLGLKADDISKSMESESIQDIIQQNKALSASIGIRGTPAFVINGELIPGAIGYEDFKQKIADARKRNAG